jgi:hypothetical protein
MDCLCDPFCVCLCLIVDTIREKKEPRPPPKKKDVNRVCIYVKSIHKWFTSFVKVPPHVWKGLVSYTLCLRVIFLFR